MPFAYRYPTNLLQHPNRTAFALAVLMLSCLRAVTIMYVVAWQFKVLVTKSLLHTAKYSVMNACMVGLVFSYSTRHGKVSVPFYCRTVPFIHPMRF